MISLIKLMNESSDDSVIEKFISFLPKYGLEYHSPQESEHAFKWRGGIYPTITDKDKKVKVALDRTDIFGRNGDVWVGDPSRPMLNGYVIQAIVTDPQNRGKGFATDILKRILKAADEAKLKLKLEPVPMGDFISKKQKGLTKPQLQKWYGKHGFEKDSKANIMTRNPLSEVEYPMAKGDDLQSYAGFEGWKGKVIWMTPDKFLHLAHPLTDPVDNTLKDLESKMKAKHPIDFLMLAIDPERNKVVGHEGRHRATVAKKLGVEKVPVLIVVHLWNRVPHWTKDEHDYVDKAEFKPEWKHLEEGQHFDLMGMRFDVDNALKLIAKKKIPAKNTDIKKYAEGVLGLRRERPEHKPQSFFAGIDYDYLDKIPEDRLKVAGIIATIRTPDKKVWSIVMDGNHRLAKNYMSGKDFMPMYVLNEKETKSIMF